MIMGDFYASLIQINNETIVLNFNQYSDELFQITQGIFYSQILFFFSSLSFIFAWDEECTGK